MQESKRTVPHSYLTSTCSIDAVQDHLAEFGEGTDSATLDSYVLNAVSKAFAKVFNISELAVAELKQDKVNYFGSSE